jgi:hypothetical protein
MLNETPTSEVATYVVNNLPEKYRKYIEETMPRSKFKDEESWIKCLGAILQNLILTHEDIVDEARKDHRFKAEIAARMRELASKKINLDERLDARIDKALKRLAQLKTFKQVLEDQGSRTKTIDHHISDQRQ